MDCLGPRIAGASQYWRPVFWWRLLAASRHAIDVQHARRLIAILFILAELAYQRRHHGFVAAIFDRETETKGRIVVPLLQAWPIA